MSNSEIRPGGVNRRHGSAIPQKLIFSLGHLLVVIFSAWLVLGSGWSTMGQLFGRDWSLADPLRAKILLGAALLYWIRHAITLFYLLQRKVDWSEALGLLVFIALFEIGLILLGGGALRDTPLKLGWLDLIALVLLLAGSFINSFSEMQRKWWKLDPPHQGHCYTGGLFSLAMHINYFGDTVLFTGWCLLSANFWSLGLPLFMTWGFISLHIPGLDKYLAERYGSEFRAYAEKTKKFVPGLY